MNRRTIRKNKKITPPKKTLTKITLFLVLILVFIFVAFLLLPSYPADQKYVIFGQSSRGDTHLLVFDPNLGGHYNIVIPGKTQLHSGYELGEWKLESIWELAIQENIGYPLVKNSLIKSFNFPINDATSVDIDKLSKGKFLTILHFILDPNSTVSPKDRLLLSRKLLFSSNANESEIFLNETSSLQKTTLLSGEEGYVIKTASLSLTKIFSQPIFYENNINIKLINNSGSSIHDQMLTQLTQNIGAKIISIDYGEINPDLSCQIESNNHKIANYLADVLDCKVIIKDTGSNLDLLLTIGKQFSNLY